MYSRELIPFQAEFPYHEYDFGLENKFGFRGYIYDVDSNGKSAMLRVSTAPKEWSIHCQYIIKKIHAGDENKDNNQLRGIMLIYQQTQN